MNCKHYHLCNLFWIKDGLIIQYLTISKESFSQRAHKWNIQKTEVLQKENVLHVLHHIFFPNLK